MTTTTKAQVVQEVATAVLQVLEQQNTKRKTVTKGDKVTKFNMFTVRINQTSEAGTSYQKTVVGTRDTKLAKIVFDALSKGGYEPSMSASADGKRWQLVK